MKTIHRLVLKSYLGPMVLTFFIVMFVLMMNIVWRYIDELVGKGFRPHDGGAVHRPAAGAQRGRRDRTLPHFVDRAEPAGRRNHRILRRVA